MSITVETYKTVELCFEFLLHFYGFHLNLPLVCVCVCVCVRVRVCIYGAHGSTVVKVLCYKSEGRWFDPSWCHWNFSLT